MKFGQLRGNEGEVGALVSLGLSMIGRWKRWEGCFVAWMGRR